MIRLLRKIYTNQKIIHNAKTDRYLIQLYVRMMNIWGRTNIQTVFTEISSHCNLLCDNCYRTGIEYPSKNMHMSFDVFKCIVDSVPHGVQYLVMQGFGESACNPEFVSMLEYASASKKFKTIILDSNLLSKDVDYYMSLFENGLTRLIVSFDSFNQEIAGRLRKGTDVDRLCTNITKIVKRYPDKINARVTVSKNNIDDLDNTVSKLIDNNIKTIEIGVLVDFKKKMIEVDESDKARILSIINKYEGKARIILDQFGLCILPFTTATFNVRGNVMPCCRIFDDEIVHFGNIKAGMVQSVYSDAFNDVRKTFYKQIPSFCRDCSYYCKL